MNMPFCQCVERLVRGLGDDSHLVATDVIDQTTTFDNGLRADENKVYPVHNVRDRGIEYNRAWNSSGAQSLVCLQTI